LPRILAGPGREQIGETRERPELLFDRTGRRVVLNFIDQLMKRRDGGCFVEHFFLISIEG
jgi:hypothetical protein